MLHHSSPKLKKVLFICSRNKWRSLTAETIYKDNMGLHVKSAGTEAAARVKVNAQMIAWADIIFVMEKHHKQKLLTRFPEESSLSEIIILEIPDKYTFMDKELIEEIELSVSTYLRKCSAGL